MEDLATALRTLEAADLVPGLSGTEVRERLRTGLRLHDTGQRLLAFYLVELQERRLHQDTGHTSAIHYAEDRLGMDRRRAGELIAVGRALLALPAIDAAFCEGGLGWTKALLLSRVATRDTEGEWLAFGRAHTCRDVEREVRLKKQGDSPGRRGNEKGLPDVRYRLNASIGVLAHQKLELAKEMLSAERGMPVNDATLLEVLAETFLATEEDGSLPGRVRVDSSLYRIVLRPDDETGGHRLLADTEIGPLPIDEPPAEGSSDDVHSACVRCDAESVCGGERAIDAKTPSALRRRILARDGHRCRCCGSRWQLQVHHIEERAKGGPTRAANLVTICLRCHALVHAGLLRIEGDPTRSARFLDASGVPLNEGGDAVPAERLLALRRDPALAPASEPSAPPRPPLTLHTMPAEIDGAWWTRHGEWIRVRPGRGLELRTGGVHRVADRDSEDGDESRAGRPADPKSLARLVGQEALVRRLVATARGRRARGRPFPHTLIEGPPGTGKTTIARGIADLLGTRPHATAGPLLTDVHVLVRVLASLGEGDVLFLDEVHAVPRAVLEVLYEALEEGRLSLTFHGDARSGARSRSVVLRLPAFTLVAATTEGGDLPEALRSRFGKREVLGHSRIADLACIVDVAATAEGFAVEPEAAQRLGLCARGSPREALHLLEHALDASAACGSEGVSNASTASLLKELGYDDEGLRRIDRDYLSILRTHGGPVSVGLLARTLDTSVRNLKRDVEPFLIHRGWVRITRQGRVAVHLPRIREA